MPCLRSIDNDGRPTGTAATEKAFTAYDIQACLYDRKRVDYLRQAIKNTVQGGDVVVDAGSGSGLLGMIAAQAGAAKVYCLELNPDFLPVIEANATRNGIADRIIAVQADATTYQLPEPVDVVISEVISAGFFYEPQIQIINNLRQRLRPGGSIVPMHMTNYLELIAAQEELYGFTFNFDSRFTDLEEDRILTHRVPYLRTDFHQPIDPLITRQVRVLATAAGTANALRITYDIRFANGVEATEPTEFLLNPQIIFLPGPLPLAPGQGYDVSLSYLASGSPLTCQVAVAPASVSPPLPGTRSAASVGQLSPTSVLDNSQFG